MYHNREEEQRPQYLQRSLSRRPQMQRTLSRGRLRQPMVADNSTRMADNFARPQEVGNHFANAQQPHVEKKRQFDSWMWLVYISTFCFPDFCLKGCGKKDARVRWAWREKMTLIFIIVLACGVLAFMTFGLQSVLCRPGTDRANLNSPPNFGDRPAWAIHGQWYAISPEDLSRLVPGTTPDRFGAIVNSGASRDLSGLFVNAFDPSSACSGATLPQKPSQCPLAGGLVACPSVTQQDLSQTLGGIGVAFEWDQIQTPGTNLMVINGIVLDMSRYLADGVKFLGDDLHQVFISQLGQDATRQVLTAGARYSAINCLVVNYQVGFVSKQSVECFTASAINYTILVIILGLILTRFVMAVIYQTIVAPSLGKEPKGIPYLPPGVVLPKQLQSKQYGTEKKENRKSFVPFKSRFTNLRSETDSYPMSSMSAAGSSNPDLSVLNGQDVLSQFDPNLFACYAIILVTMYSESESEIYKSLTSISETEYPDKKKLIFMISDGLITGGGASKSTPQVCVDMLNLHGAPEPQPKSYVAIADGAKQHNMAKVYCGSFDHNGSSTPVILVVKCGTPAEARDPKPGNRGKRDSQIILMNFLSKVMFDDRMTALEYDVFTKIKRVTGVFPDRYEVLLMIDADTRVSKESLPLMINALRNDVKISGICGETLLSNPLDSWVTAIQTFEYQINHTLNKSFESLFGGVSCLPGCFSMYRIKSPKGNQGYWVPILANPDVIEEYSQNVVETLHQKNLLLLGEDRFLSTLMLKTFPKRHMMFLPQATCETVVPDKFSVLLSQRRRWINSTVHNLAELVFVKDLCGTFCISMQFVVLMDLLSTIVLPAAIVFTVFLIVVICTPNGDFVKNSLLPLITLLIILVAPAILVALLSRKWSTLMYAAIYLSALVVWNLILPAYSFWHFDDFSWGKTREVEGEDGGDHSAKEGQFDGSQIVMKRWSEWEAMKRTQKMRAQTSRQSPRQEQNLVPRSSTYRHLASSVSVAAPIPVYANDRDYIQPHHDYELRSQGRTIEPQQSRPVFVSRNNPQSLAQAQNNIAGQFDLPPPLARRSSLMGSTAREKQLPQPPPMQAYGQQQSPQDQASRRKRDRLKASTRDKHQYD